MRRNWQKGHQTPHSIPCDGDGIYCLQYDDDKLVLGNRVNTVKVRRKGVVEGRVSCPSSLPRMLFSPILQ